MPAGRTTTRKKTSTSRTTARTSTGRKTAPRKSATSGSVASRSSSPVASRQKGATKKAASKPARKVAKTGAKSGAKAAAKGATRGAASAAEQLREYQRKRDFTKTAEPSGSARSKAAPKGASKRASKSPSKRPSRKAGELRFVIQKHAASHLHYDLRLEIDGVMKSWAVPKGPSADPTVRRLAMQVEDHPVEYNTFEGTIPAGEYGGGTVMIWDTGTYSVEGADARGQNAAAHDEYASGDLKVSFHGKRIRGSYALVRTRSPMRGNSNPDKPAWLLIKHRDDDSRAEDDFDLTREYVTSAVSGRSMDEIRERGRVYGE